jgi:hypothetical protein
LTSGKNFEGVDHRVDRDVEWKAGHDRLAARSTRGVSLMVANSGHYIQLDQPDVVVSAIETVVHQVRENGSEHP